LKFEIFIVGGDAIIEGYFKTGTALEDAKLEDVGTKESEETVCDGSESGGFFFVVILGGKEGGVELHLGEEVVDLGVGVMNEMVGEGEGVFVFDGFVNESRGKMGGSAVVEAGDAVGIPAAGANPEAFVVVFAGDGVDFLGIEGEGEDFGDEGGFGDFIAVYGENPGVC
jgi:hypothetical protein